MSFKSKSKSTSPVPVLPLRKGLACTNCRRRKIKCDGVKPRCGPCTSSSSAWSDCQFSDEGSTESEILEGEIARLEARLAQLSSPTARKTSGSKNKESINVNLPQGCHGLPASAVKVCLSTFLRYSSELYFFLDVERLQRFLQTPQSCTSSPALLATMCLWGASLSTSPDIRAYETPLLSRASESVAHSIGAPTIIHTLQSQILLALYLLHSNRLVEGKYFTTAAVSLTLASGIHQIRSPTPVSTGVQVLPPAADLAEEEERIRAFWNVFVMANFWTSGDGSHTNKAYTPSGVSNEGVRIDTPWPGSTKPSSFNVISRFLDRDSDEGISPFALMSKASILFEQSATLAKAVTNLGADAIDEFWTRFQNLNALADRILHALPPLQPAHIYRVGDTPRRLTLLMHTLVHVAIIQLHMPFLVSIDDNHATRGRCIDAARSVVRATQSVPNVHDFEYIDPIVATLWFKTCKALLDGVIAIQLNSGWAAGGPSVEDLKTDLDVMESAMRALAPRCKLMASQLRVMENLR
ncbi:hypothetical protein BD626DRAFT_477243 [Schizophyllum amplum]|uniref:Zn(2)-C6 fungal-type domain-containing protein n=1 Tax=Schizophyllum amplum TaxID=97359 RepID=A0A550D007_9AGAR|nr:hypothetical protein BD626DRAFT_477243 [Auriculariopsis ampla]